MDAFFASIEQRDNPELRGKAIAVGGSPRKGVVAAASYEARKFGVRSAMPGHTAAKLCPSLIFVRPNFNKYMEASNQIMNIFKEYTNKIEAISIDEAYLDVTDECVCLDTTAVKIAKEIKLKIKTKLDLTASAGVSFNKFLAKVGSGYNKPDGLKVIIPDEAPDFIDKLPVAKIPGLGKVTQEKMYKLGINFGIDIKRRDKDFMERAFGKMGIYYFDLVNLNYFSPVNTERIRKSVGAERTFEDNITDLDIMKEKLKIISDKISDFLIKRDIMGRTITLKIKYDDFVMINRSKTLEHYIQSPYEILDMAVVLLSMPMKPTKPVRLLGISISNLNINEINSRVVNQLNINFLE